MFSILYIKDGQLYGSGQFHTAGEADAWAEDHEKSLAKDPKDVLFDIATSRVYRLNDDRSFDELGPSFFGVC